MLSELIGLPVLDPGGERRGRLRDLAVHLPEQYPPVLRVRIGTGRRERVIAAERAASFEGGAVRLNAPWESLSEQALGRDEIWLGVHVLDTQVVDVGGRRLVRVGDVALDETDGALRLRGVEIGKAAVLRRLGLRRLGRRLDSELVDWRELHVTSGRAHKIQLGTSAARVHRLTPSELEAVIARLPAHRAAEVVEAVKPTPPKPAPVRRPRRRRYHRILRARRRAPS
jgi:sporulation protein YlmC with PRC-barrel domain